MRNIIKKTTAVVMIAGAALAVSACGKTETTNTTENASMTELNATEGSMNDMSATGNMSDNAMMGSNSSNAM